MVGDTYTKFSAATVPAGSYLEIKPGAGIEVIIHNIYHEADVELKLVDSSANELAFMQDAGESVITNMYFHVTEDQYLRVYNRGVAAQWLAADGVISAE